MINIPTKMAFFPKNIKVWGWTQSIALNESSHFAIAHLNKGGFSSKHIHEKLYNRFYVISGKLRIIVYRNEREEVIDLSSGEAVDIEPLISHRMEALEDSMICEIYWSESNEPINPTDIVRYDNGNLR